MVYSKTLTCSAGKMTVSVDDCDKDILDAIPC